ncbi:CgeB family protein [Geomesophilobacter sediminis]|uniref:Glycosyltransferase n=1 Tax=Geomesophilobacter sediminis TaxID=2798584 RepID=A0A8J7IS82_9BACT|nr:glycosyltransferase [Geomesophilobacter sediminis]MBJ6726079.1 glycosyltransferase [Geomesophilobacter sediminis]
MGLNIAFFGSSLVSSYWNGAATYYRGLIRALNLLGHRVTFYEPDAYDRQQHRDMKPPRWARVVVYPATRAGVYRALEGAQGADLVVKASGVGVFDELLEQEVLALKRPGNQVVFWDVDAPATLQRLRENPSDPFRVLVPRYDMILTYGGGDPIVAAYTKIGARGCVPIYNALDPSTHHPVRAEDRLRADLSFLGNRLPDRERRVEEFFFEVARRLGARRFILAGAGWDDKSRGANITYLGHLGTRDHNAFNCSSLAVLNVSRSSMAENGFSPATRVFEAAGAGACVITDSWDGVECFFEPGNEILVAASGAEVAAILDRLTPAEALQVGRSALARVKREHTYAHRARQFETIFGAARGKS